MSACAVLRNFGNQCTFICECILSKLSTSSLVQNSLFWVFQYLR